MSKQQTDIGSCPIHWEVVRLNDVAELKHGYQFRTHDFTEQGIKVFKITQIQNDSSIDLSSCSYIDESRLGSFEKYIINYGDILMALSGATIGKIGRFKSHETVLQNYRVGNFIPTKTEKLDKDYFYYFLSTENTFFQILANQNQSAQENVGKEDIHKMLVFLPPMNEQKAIASVLGCIDNKIELLHRQNSTLEKMAETLFRQWFIEEAKEDWATGKVSDLIKILSGFAFKSSSFVESGKYCLITIKGVQDGYLELNNADRIEELPDRLPEFCKLEIGDILLSLTGNVGRCCLVDTKDLLLNQRVAKLEPMKERDRAYTYFLFRQPQIKQLLEEMGKGTAQSNLSPIETSNMELIIPDESKLEEFSAIATPWLNKLLFNRKSIQTLSQLRDSLLPKLMSGEVSVEIK